MKVNELKIGAILSYVLLGLKTIEGIVFTPFLTKCLGQREYGLYSLVASIIGYLTVLDFGFGNAIIIYTTRYKTKNEKEKEYKLNGMFTIIYTIIGIIAAGIGILLYQNVEAMFGSTMTAYEIEKAKIMLLILTLNLAITFPFTIFSSIITAYEKFVFAKLINIFRTILTPIIMVALLLYGYKSVALVIVTTAVNVICLLINAVYCFKKLKIKIHFGKFDFSLLKEISIYSFFIFLGIIMDKINWNLDQFILGAIVGTTAVAIYNVASQFSTIYQSFSTAISGVMLPKITKMISSKATNEEISDIFIRTGRIQYIIMGLVITGFIIFGMPFITSFFGEQYYQSYYIACILMIPVTIPLIQNVGISIMQAKNMHKFRTISYLLIAIGNVIISIPLAKLYSGVGAAIGTAISLIIGAIITMNIYYYKRVHINIPKFWKEIAKMSMPVLISLIIGIVCINYIGFHSKIILFLEMIVYCIIYFILIWKFGMNKYEKEIFSKPLKLIKGKIKVGENP